MISPDYTFSIFKHIHSTNGAHALTLARDFERKSIALARYKKHLTFNHLLKSHGVLPPSLSFTPPIRTKEGYKIARKAGLKYLRLRITHCHNNIKALTKFYFKSRMRTTAQHHKFPQIYTGNCTVEIPIQHLFMVFRKFTNLDVHCAPLQAV